MMMMMMMMMMIIIIIIIIIIAIKTLFVNRRMHTAQHMQMCHKM